MTEPLGLFTPAELRAGGINRRGLLQPLIPPGVGIEDGEAVTDSPRLRNGEWVEPFGPLALVLRMAAVARSVVVVERAGGVLPWLLFGRIGRTTHVLDLQPDRDNTAYVALRTTPASAAASLADDLGVAGDGQTSLEGPPARELLEDQATTLATIKGASILRPDAPLLQQRLALAARHGERWLILGTRMGEEIGWSAAPPTPQRVEGTAVAMLSGRPAKL